jgi:hypothetical protein
MRRPLHILFWLTLSMWLALIAAPAMTAISAFTQLPRQGAMIPEYEAYFAEDPEGMGRMVAGYVTDPVFIATDRTQWIMAPLALLFGILALRPFRIGAGPGQYICLLALTAALGLVILHNASMAPRMQENLNAYRTAAANDMRADAEKALAAFDIDHKIAEPLFGIRMMLVIVGIVAAAGATRLADREPSTTKETG